LPDDPLPTEPSANEATSILVARAKEGDRAALEALFVRSYDRLERVVRIRFGEPRGRRFELKDVIQEAFGEAFRRLHQFEPRAGARFLDWVARIAENKLRSGWRRETAKKRDERRELRLAPPDESSPLTLDRALADPGPTPSQVAHAADLSQRIDACLAQLDVEEREVLILRYYLDASWPEIGESMERTAAAAEQLGRRAKLRLARLLSKDGITPEDHA